jgi:pimeloyl-ACP methyl ester carboxylesterase
VEAGDIAGLERVLAADLPAAVRDGLAARRYLGTRARALAGTPVSRLLRGLPTLTPVPTRTALRPVTAACLVVGQEHDPLHPSALARELAAALGPAGAECVVFPEFGVRWNARARLRAVIAGFLNPL